MKIEKINDNQIRCTLTKTDLEKRDIQISELAYGSEKAKSLFKEMTEKANEKFGFLLGDAPLMVEAVPLKNDSLSLVLSKIDEPEELDTRFAKLTPSIEDLEEAAQLESEMKEQELNGANDILNMMDNFKKALAENLLPSFSELKKTLLGIDDNNIQNSPDTGSNSTHDSSNVTSNKTINNNNEIIPDDFTITYRFSSIDMVIDLSAVLSDKYHGVNNLYLNHSDNMLYLTLCKSDHTPEEFNKICNIACEYGDKLPLKKNIMEFYNEHYELLLEAAALQELTNCR